jgi:hypothetical protein
VIMWRRPDDEEPSATIYVPAWLKARKQLTWVEDEDARELLTSAMDQVESGWERVRGLQLWAERHSEARDVHDDYGALLSFAASGVHEVFRSLAGNLAALVAAWPGQDLPAEKDLDGRLDEFTRSALVLVLATAAAVDVPEEFRDLVRLLTHFRPGGSWATRLASTFHAIEDVSDAELTADSARQAVDLLLHGIPEAEREGVAFLLMSEVAAHYARKGQKTPPWLQIVTDYLTGAAPPEERHSEGAQ